MTAETAPSTPPVVAGVDGSDSALAAVRWAAVEADRRGAPLRLVTAFPWNRDSVASNPLLGERYCSELAARARVDALQMMLPRRQRQRRR